MTIVDGIYSPKNEPVNVTTRMRLQCRTSTAKGRHTFSTALNDVNIHRGSMPSLARMDCHINETLLTSAVVDGLLVSTPTGSTAYSLSAGGPVVHPQVEALLLTPVCPRSLSFRPAVLPATAKIGIRVSRGRGPVQLSVDGREPIVLDEGAEVVVTRSLHPMRVVCRKDATVDWVHSINSLLSYNLRFSERIIDEQP